MKLLGVDELERSAVVANCRMNRERNLAGTNGYSTDLGFNPLSLLEEKTALSDHIRWLDLCCGSGKALIEAAQIVQGKGWDARVEIVGVDLVGMFQRTDSELKCLRLMEASLSVWKPDRQFDLITCVHGLHYIGDKLSVIARAVSWLNDDGRFAANLDLKNFRLQDGRPAGRIVVAEMRSNGLQYQARKRLIICRGRRVVKFPFRFVGADDEAGPNYTGQPTIDSYYRTI